MMEPIEKAVNDYESERASSALGSDFAADYILVKGVKVYYQTVSHAWMIPALTSRMQDVTDFDRGLITFYLLTMSADEVRSRAEQEFRDGRLLQCAMDFVLAHEIYPEDIKQSDIERLMTHPYKKHV